MSHAFVRVEREGPLTVVTIDRPGSLNALHAPAQAELAAVFDDFARDDAQWVAIITGAGDRAYCAGHAVLRDLSTSVDDALFGCWGYPAMRAMLVSEDAIEGATAFAGKRPLKWIGNNLVGDIKLKKNSYLHGITVNQCCLYRLISLRDKLMFCFG